MRFVWYPMGVTKLAAEPIMMATAKGMGSMASDPATCSAMGNMRTAAALAFMTLVNSMVRPQTTASSRRGSLPAMDSRPSVIQVAAPLVSMARPMPSEAAMISSICQSTLRRAAAAVQQPVTIMSPVTMSAALSMLIGVRVTASTMAPSSASARGALSWRGGAESSICDTR